MRDGLIRIACPSCDREHEIYCWCGEGDTEAQVMVPCACQHESPEDDKQACRQALEVAATW